MLNEVWQLGLLYWLDSFASGSRTPLPVGLGLLCLWDSDSSASWTWTPLPVGLGLLCRQDSFVSQNPLPVRLGLLCRSDSNSSAGRTWTPLPVRLGLLCRSDWDSSASQTRTPLPVGLRLLFQSGYSAGWTPLQDGLLCRTDFSAGRTPLSNSVGLKSHFRPKFLSPTLLSSGWPSLLFVTSLVLMLISLIRPLLVGLCQLDFASRTLRSDFAGWTLSGRFLPVGLCWPEFCQSDS